MSAWFGGKKKVEETVLVLDIESGSVGSALARISTKHAPKLFADNRVALPVPATLDAHKLLRATEKATQEALLHTATIAGRLRTSALYTGNASQKASHTIKNIAKAGTVDRAEVFLSPPWSDFTPAKRGNAWTHEPLLLAQTRKAIEQVFGAILITFHPLGSMVAQTTYRLFEQPDETLFATLGGEVLELVLSQEGRLRGRSTLPVGTNTLVRTLQTHGGISLPEARSALHLARFSTMSDTLGNHSPYAQPLAAVQQLLLSHINTVSDELLRFSQAGTIIVVAPEPVGELLARGFASEPALLDIFPHRAQVRALHTHHLTPHLAAHAPNPDLLLILEALAVEKCITQLAVPSR